MERIAVAFNDDAHLKTQLNHIPASVVGNHSLPLGAVAVNIAQEFIEDPGPNVTHAAHNHFISARADLRDAFGKQAAFARLVNQSSQVS